MYDLPRGEIDGVGRRGDEPLAGVVAVEDSIDAFKVRKTLGGRDLINVKNRPSLDEAISPTC
jgi:hypothetical protein